MTKKKSIVDSLQRIEPPQPINQEDPNLLAVYYKDIISLYKQRPALTDYSHNSLSMNMDKSAVNQFILKTETFLADQKMTDKIKAIYPSVIKEVDSL